MSKIRSFTKLWELVSPHKGTFLIGMLGLIGGSAINLFLPQLVRHVINNDITLLLTRTPIKFGVVLGTIFALQGLFFYLRSLYFGLVGQRIVEALRSKLFSVLLNQQVGYFDSTRTGDLMTRLTADTQMIQEAVSIRLSVLLRYSLQVGVGVILMAWISLRLTFFLLLILPVLVAISIVLGKRLRALSKRVQELLGQTSIIAEESFGSIRLVKAYVNEPYEVERFQRRSTELLEAGIRRTKLSAFFSSFVSFLMNFAITVVLIIGARLVALEAGLSVGDLAAFLLYGVIVAVSFAFVSSSYSEIVQGLGATERVFEIIDTPPLPEPRTNLLEKSILPPLEREITFQGVFFAYPSRQETYALRNLSLSFKANTTTALVGPSGAGKSTITHLLMRFYEPSKGDILFDGTPLASFPLNEVRRSIALVPQEPPLFSVSIAENLRYGKRSATEKELRTACEQANLIDFIDGLPEGFNTECGPRGITLSGGERQRLAIARAILSDRPILILDEATSQLDSENEALIQEALRNLFKGRTAIVVAHRLSTIQTADQVFVLQGGEIVQKGDHRTLSDTPGLYQDLARHQQLVVGS